MATKTTKQKVQELAAKGLGPTAISRKLSVSLTTVNWHLGKRKAKKEVAKVEAAPVAPVSSALEESKAGLKREIEFLKEEVARNDRKWQDACNKLHEVRNNYHADTQKMKELEEENNKLKVAIEVLKELLTKRV